MDILDFTLPDLSGIDLPEIEDTETPDEAGLPLPVSIRPHAPAPAAFRRMVCHFAAGEKAGNLRPDEEAELVLRWQERGERAALGQLLSSHSRLLSKIAGRLAAEARRRDLADDILGEVALAFIGACSRWDSSRNTRLTTFASHAMTGAGRKFLLGARLPLSVGTSSDERRAIYGRDRILQRFIVETGRPFTGADEDFEILARLVDISPRALKRGMEVHRLRSVALEDVQIEADPLPAKADTKITRAIADSVAETRQSMKPRDFAIFFQTLKIAIGESALSIDALARAAGVTPTRIGQIRRAGTLRLREALASRGIRDVADAI